MKIDLHYGTGLVSLQVPDSNIQDIIRPWQEVNSQDGIASLHKAIVDQADRLLRELTNKRVCVLVDDGTREEPFHEIFPELPKILQKCSFVQFLICTGTHNPNTPENEHLKQAIAQAMQIASLSHFQIHTHDCQSDKLLEVGQTSRGTEILANALVDKADAFLVVSDVKVHYFAGYSNPIKNFIPGICAYQTTEQNHRLALLERSTHSIHPWHKDSRRRDNPLAADQLEGMRLIAKDRPIYAFVTISAAGHVLWARLGSVRSVSAEAFAVTDERNIHTVASTGRLIVSPGGLPNDTNLYVAQRALELTKAAVTKSGEILLLAACPNGIGEAQTIKNFYNRLTAPIDDIINSIEHEYELYNHKPYKFAQMIQRLRRIYVYSEIPDHLIAAAHLYPTHNPQAIIEDWLSEQPDTKIIIVDGANKIALRSL
jgi:nickel-dependent lactate racemase